MKSSKELRLECIKLASILATAKLVPPGQVVPTAMEYLKWIDGDDDASADPDAFRSLARKYNSR
jgi:hypothetical protein